MGFREADQWTQHGTALQSRSHDNVRQDPNVRLKMPGCLINFSQKTPLSLLIKDKSTIWSGGHVNNEAPNLLGFDQAHQIRLSLALSDLLSVRKVELPDSDTNGATQIQEQRAMLVELANSFERRVTERTEQLLKKNAQLIVDRDQAIKSNELKSQFVANVSHEIRTPMCGILGLTEELLEISDNEEAHELATFILSSAKDLMRTVNDLLDFSKLEKTQLSIIKTPFDLKDFSEKIYQSVLPSARAKGIHIQNHLDPELELAVSGDNDRISQILLNLVHNAIKFTQQGGVDVRITRQKCLDNKQYIQFEVEDTGIGISKINLKRLFVPYVQAQSDTEQNFGGTGLGLAICKSLVEQMDGVIDCDSTPGVGSRFSFILPLDLA